MKVAEWFESGKPWIWLTAGAVSISMVMVFGLLGLIAARGLHHFWPKDVIDMHYVEPDGQVVRLLGEIHDSEVVTAARLRSAGIPLPEDADVETRYLLKTGNRDVTDQDFRPVIARYMTEVGKPEAVVVLERREWGNFYGFLQAVEEHGQVVAAGLEAWAELQARIERTRGLHEQIRHIERNAIGDVNYAMERLRLRERRQALDGELSDAAKAAIGRERTMLDREYAALQEQLAALNEEIARDSLTARTVTGEVVHIPLSKVVRAYRPNAMSTPQKLHLYLVKVWEFLTDEPREANTEGGIFPAIFGTVLMVIIMAIIVTPVGVVAAVYLREYARQGPLLRLVRVSVYNLAGVPSVVYGVFGLGFFVYFLGGNIDRLFYPEALPAPTFGTPGILWAALTLAVLTLPVVIVATEEGLTRIPRAYREGSLALGATQAETLWRVVLPMASPAMMTGLILAIARAAGEVAPLMLVGVVKLAPSLPLDGNFPYLHLDRKFMHLGFHIYDVGFQSPNVEAARPLVYATSLLLVLVIVVLNLTAIHIRNRLREQYRTAGQE